MDREYDDGDRILQKIREADERMVDVKQQEEFIGGNDFDDFDNIEEIPLFLCGMKVPLALQKKLFLRSLKPLARVATQVLQIASIYLFVSLSGRSSVELE